MKKAAIFFITLVLSLQIITPVFADDATAQKNYWDSIMDFIHYNNQTDMNNQQLTEQGLKGMLESVDPYTTYFTKKEMEGFMGSVNNSYQGIGVSITVEDGYIMVYKIFSGSPAQKAGVLPQDKILSVGETSLKDESTDKAASLIRGEPGTDVEITIAREGKEPFKLKITRAAIKINPVTYEVIGDIAYIRMDTFSSDLAARLAKVLKAVDAKKLTKVIIDLRDNGGGELDSAIDVAKNFVPKGLIAKLDYKAEDKKDEEYYSTLEKLKYKVAVLVNGNTASASEIVAGAIQDTSAGVLIGTKTFGKSRVQNLAPILTKEAYEKYSEQYGASIVDGYDLMDKYNADVQEDEVLGWVKITTGEYLTPKGNRIDLKGLEPDIKIDDPKGQEYPIYLEKLSLANKPALDDRSIDVSRAEGILKLAGYDVDKPDTTLDAKTFAAIGKFQQDVGLFSYGVLDFTTQRALNQKRLEMIREYDLQFAAAEDYLGK